MENTEDKIQNLRDGRVATMTTDTDASLSVPKNETKEDTKPNANLLKRIDELTRERVNAFETQQRKLEEEERRQLEKKLENAQKTEVIEVTEIASSKAEQVDEESVSMPKYIGETELQTESVEDEETQVQDQAEQKQRAKKVKYRVKFISIAVCIAVALFSGLAIHNAVKITRLSSEVAAAQQQIEVNTTKYIYKISKLDDLIEKGKEAPADSFQIGADRYLESFPEEIEDVTEVPQKSNWFDRFVDKIRKFFGRA